MEGERRRASILSLLQQNNREREKKKLSFQKKSFSFEQEKQLIFSRCHKNNELREGLKSEISIRRIKKRIYKELCLLPSFSFESRAGYRRVRLPLWGSLKFKRHKWVSSQESLDCPLCTDTDMINKRFRTPLLRYSEPKQYLWWSDMETGNPDYARRVGSNPDNKLILTPVGFRSIIFERSFYLWIRLYEKR